MVGQFLYASGAAVIAYGHGTPHGKGHVEAHKQNYDLCQSGFCNEYGGAYHYGDKLAYAMGGC
jgi:hypothetical protein